VIEVAVRLWQFLVTEPAALHVYLSYRADEETARHAYRAIHIYTTGFAALEASRAGWDPGNSDVRNLVHEFTAYITDGHFTRASAQDRTRFHDWG
jgi:hypothetical protein